MMGAVIVVLCSTAMIASIHKHRLATCTRCTPCPNGHRYEIEACQGVWTVCMVALIAFVIGARL